MSSTILSKTIHQALLDTFPVGMGYIPLSIAYALLISNAGVPWYFALLMSFTIYAGALQFFAANMVTAVMPLPEVAMTTLIINFRHIFYGLSFPMKSIKTPFKRWYAMFALTDETYSLLASQNHKKRSENYIFTVQLLNQSYWILGTIIGLSLNSILNQPIKGIEFILTALFIVLAQEHFYRKTVNLSLILGLTAALVAFWVLPKQFLSLAIATYLVFLVIHYNFTFKNNVKEQETKA
ncbi:AzlC family ABC transporter permease [Thorsellia anophelis]|uniref:4-azaleucine resistance probable transporter AzlC n=1 Tax=Thorsellia anophelis DSM 18579 TaxID=1123402 RepID=A0A1H9ZXC7_9GAMM|nr:AzlC family ABC transporter permease [Thorsellia anophelis]SES86036.1 4-azaleucine resistance probable transporter AzlC [Thorsellia anophelis DSM 18579]